VMCAFCQLLLLLLWYDNLLLGVLYKLQACDITVGKWTFLRAVQYRQAVEVAFVQYREVVEAASVQ